VNVRSDASYVQTCVCVIWKATGNVSKHTSSVLDLGCSPISVLATFKYLPSQLQAVDLLRYVSLWAAKFRQLEKQQFAILKVRHLGLKLNHPCSCLGNLVCNNGSSLEIGSCSLAFLGS
jgi:hypothetical protein